MPDLAVPPERSVLRRCQHPSFSRLKTKQVRSDEMILSPWILIEALLLALGLWCREMLPRWREDFRKLRKSNDWSDRTTVIVLWSITAAIIYLCVQLALSVGGYIVHGIRELV